MIGQLGFFTILTILGIAQDVAPPKFEFKPPVVRGSIFDDKLGLLDRERDEYARAIANFVTNFVASKKADPDSLAFARKGLGLALHLSTRNKRAMVTKFQLSKGTVPRPGQNRIQPGNARGTFRDTCRNAFPTKGRGQPSPCPRADRLGGDHRSSQRRCHLCIRTSKNRLR